MYSFTYEMVKRINEDRRRESLARYQATRQDPDDTFVRPETSESADIIDLVFGTGCPPESIGA